MANFEGRFVSTAEYLLQVPADAPSFTIGLAAADGPTHSWVLDFRDEVLLALREDAIAAGWRFLVIDDPARRPLEVDDLHDPRLCLESDAHAVLDELAALVHDGSVEQKVLVAVGSGIDATSAELRALTQNGAAAGIHLAVSIELATPGRGPQASEFSDLITGMWRGESVTVDQEAGAAYVKIRRASRIASTMSPGRGVLVDLTDDGQIVGVEILSAADPSALAQLRSPQTAQALYEAARACLATT